MRTLNNTLAPRRARWRARHRKLAIFGWLAAVAVAVVVGGMVGGKTLTEADSLSGESARAQRMLDAGGVDRPVMESVVVQSRELRATDVRFRAVVEDVVAAVGATAIAYDVREAAASKDGHSVLVQFAADAEPHEAMLEIAPVLEVVERLDREHPGFRIEEFGGASLGRAFMDTAGKDFQRAEILSIPVTVLILLLAFGAVMAAVLPVILALTAIAGATGLVTLTSQLFPIDHSTNSVMLLIGLAVGVDYSLFYIRREREERAAGRSAEAALEAAAATSGRAVLISGLTVIVAVAGMFLAGTGTFLGIAMGTILVVAMAVVGSVTVLPALLSKLGDRIEKGRVPLLRRAEGGGRFWNAVLTPVLRRPKLATALAGGLLVVLALPAFSMKTVMPGVSDLPRELPIIQTYERIQAAFPGGPLPAQIVVRSDELASERVATAVRELRAEALATGLMDDPVHFQVIGNGTVGIVSVPLAGDGQDALSNRALETLRERVIPATLGKLDGVEVAVGGDTAVSKDFSDTMKARAPVVFAFVLGLAFLLLLVTFRSIVIPLKAILLNLLSVGAAYGALVALFQWGWGESLLGFESTGGITSWLPVFLFVVLFGLSMDYHVFILSRVREAYDNGMTTGDAVAHGIRSTAGIVTSAALVMVLVFAIFGTLSQVSMKQAGVGLAVAVFLDATIVRAVLLPATMKLLGEANWWLPKRLEWLPKVVEPAPAR